MTDLLHRLREGEGADTPKPRRKYKRKCKVWPRCSCILQGTTDDCLMPIWAYVPRIALITAKEQEHDR